MIKIQSMDCFATRILMHRLHAMHIYIFICTYVFNYARIYIKKKREFTSCQDTFASTIRNILKKKKERIVDASDAQLFPRARRISRWIWRRVGRLRIYRHFPDLLRKQTRNTFTRVTCPSREFFVFLFVFVAVVISRSSDRVRIFNTLAWLNVMLLAAMHGNCYRALNF